MKESKKINETHYWHNPINTRYYKAYVKKDLLDDWVVMVCWGKKGTNLGRSKTVYCADEISTGTYLKKLHQTRFRHGYVKIEG